MFVMHSDASSADRDDPVVASGRARRLRRLVVGYQKYLSPLKLGPSCRFTPSCSAYALTALARHGALKGTVLSLARLAKCGPWHPGGWDPVPPVHRRSRRHR
jgi:putative membrane protein insertion efficiency factor